MEFSENKKETRVWGLGFGEEGLGWRVWGGGSGVWGNIESTDIVPLKGAEIWRGCGFYQHCTPVGCSPRSGVNLVYPV